ncbi:MAG: hypothetical protein ACXADA_17175 [Candidatus Hodarchaeales archaeon]
MTYKGQTTPVLAGGGCQKLASSDPIKEKCLLDGCNDSMYRFVKIHDRYTSRRLDEC